MRWGGMLATLFVIIAVILGLMSVGQIWGLDGVGIASLVWPAAVGAALFVAAVFALGRWSLRILPADDEGEADDAGEETADQEPTGERR